MPEGRNGVDHQENPDRRLVGARPPTAPTGHSFKSRWQLQGHLLYSVRPDGRWQRSVVLAAAVGGTGTFNFGCSHQGVTVGVPPMPADVSRDQLAVIKIEGMHCHKCETALQKA